MTFHFNSAKLHCSPFISPLKNIPKFGIRKDISGSIPFLNGCTILRIIPTSILRHRSRQLYDRQFLLEEDDDVSISQFAYHREVFSIVFGSVQSYDISRSRTGKILAESTQSKGWVKIMRPITWVASFLLVAGCFPPALGGSSENHLKSVEATRGNPEFKNGVVYKLRSPSALEACKYDHGQAIVKFQTAEQVREANGMDVFHITYSIKKAPGTLGIAETVRWEVQSRHYDEDGKRVDTVIGDDASDDKREELTGRGIYDIPHNDVKDVTGDGELLFPSFRPVNMTCF